MRAPPPQLHLHMGVVNSVMDIIIKVWGLDETLAWCQDNFIIRRGYHGGQFDGNNSKKILDCLPDLAEFCPTQCLPLVDLLHSFQPIVSGCFGSDLVSNYRDLIANFKKCFIQTQRYVTSKLDLSLTVTWKIHVLILHLPEFLDRSNCSMARYSEQTGESVHHSMKKVLSRYKVSEVNPKHGEKLKKAVVEFSTERV